MAAASPHVTDVDADRVAMIWRCTPSRTLPAVGTCAFGAISCDEICGAETPRGTAGRPAGARLNLGERRQPTARGTPGRLKGLAAKSARPSSLLIWGVELARPMTFAQNDGWSGHLSEKLLGRRRESPSCCRASAQSPAAAGTGSSGSAD